MLKSLNIKNFKSFKDATLELSDFTLMIGANASGKTNAIEALQYVSWILTGTQSFEEFVKERDLRLLNSKTYDSENVAQEFGVAFNNLDSSYQCKIIQIKEEPAITSQFITDDDSNTYSITDSIIRNVFIKSNYLTQDLSSIDKEINSGIFGAVLFGALVGGLLGGQKGAAFGALTGIALQGQVDSSTKQQPVITEEEMKDAKKWLEIKNNFLQGFANCYFLDASPHLMRDYVPKAQVELTTHGENLSAILYKLCTENGTAKDNKKIILNFVKSLPEQNIVKIDFVKPQEDVKVKIKEQVSDDKESGKEFDASSLSDGTLRVLAIVAYLLSAPKNSFLIIEEVDNGIHPARLKIFIEKLRNLAKEREIQVLMTSHNPALLNAMPQETIKDIISCYRDEKEGDSRLRRLGDLPRFSQLIAQGDIGDLVANGKVSKHVHDNRTAENLRDEGLKWLDEFYNKAKEVE